MASTLNKTALLLKQPERKVSEFLLPLLLLKCIIFEWQRLRQFHLKSNCLPNINASDELIFTGKLQLKKLKTCLAPNMWLRSSVGSSAQLVSGRHGFKPRRSLNFFQASFSAISLIAVYLQGSIHHLLPTIQI